MTEFETSKGRRPSRRQFLALGVGAFVVSTIPWVRRQRVLVHRTVPAMGTVVEIAVAHRDRQFAHAAMDAAVEDVYRVERLMSRFSATSEVGRANLTAGREAVLLSRETARVLRAALDWAEASDGAFDPGVGAVVATWDVGHRHEPPPATAVRRLANRRFYRAIDLDTWSGRPAVRFTDREVQIDLGGIAKGYAVDAAVLTLRDWGVRDALVNAGGDLYALGESADGNPWNIGVRSASDPERITTTLELSNQAVATSGDYFQYFDYRGRRYHHLLDPATAEPRITPLHSISVRADNCMAADAAATTLFGIPAKAAEHLLGRRSGAAHIVQSQVA
ncbi:MAG: FAD:protein FMN transferase [Gemmatimonadetes bacterium]|nr:FAD:protein FMN transferase [Gemmatimonadota bacterium]